MREIKFRQWHEELEVMEYWAMIDNTQPPIYKDSVVMQYTGLKDKSGEEIYEGDILKCLFTVDGKRLLIHADEYMAEDLPAGTIEIRWDYSGFIGHIINKPDSYIGRYIDLVDCEDMEVIGNIYENFELLEEA